MRLLLPLMLLAVLVGMTSTARAAEKLRVLIVDGFNPYHEWQVTTPLMKQILEKSGRFEVDVATVPIPEGYKPDLSGPLPRIDSIEFHPKFADYDVVIGNYIGPRWPEETEQDFVKFVESGHGFVPVHSADNAFADWPEYSRMCGVGGWYGRNEKTGPHVYLDDAGKEVRDTTAGAGGHHGPQHEYQVHIRDTEHPITQGLPTTWVHTKDELYDTLRGPATDMHILGDRVQRSQVRRHRQTRTDADGASLRSGPSVSHGAWARRLFDEVRRLSNDAVTRHRMGRHGRGDDSSPREFPHRRQSAIHGMTTAHKKSPGVATPGLR